MPASMQSRMRPSLPIGGPPSPPAMPGPPRMWLSLRPVPALSGRRPPSTPMVCRPPLLLLSREPPRPLASSSFSAKRARLPGRRDSPSRAAAALVPAPPAVDDSASGPEAEGELAAVDGPAEPDSSAFGECLAPSARRRSPSSPPLPVPLPGSFLPPSELRPPAVVDDEGSPGPSPAACWPPMREPAPAAPDAAGPSCSRRAACASLPIAPSGSRADRVGNSSSSR
jgi:hypothetical protein